MHMSFGPSNLRMWDLPINGVLQVTDNPVGTSKLFDVGAEICCYDNGDIERAIGIIDYYLSHERERLEIARAGYRRVKYDYSFQQCWWRILPAIEQGILEKKVS
jgi:spore maturation protein CgeB